MWVMKIEHFQMSYVSKGRQKSIPRPHILPGMRSKENLDKRGSGSLLFLDSD